MHLVVSGTRHGRPDVRYWLTRWVRRFGRPEGLIVGCARGVDRQAIRWAYRNDIPVDKHVAKWRVGGRTDKRAGRDRNERMIDAASPGSWLIAFPDVESRGTPHAVSYARGKGLHLYVCAPAWPERSTLRPTRGGPVVVTWPEITVLANYRRA